MAFTEQSLRNGERLIAIAKFHWSHTALSYLALTVPLLILVSVFHFLSGEARESVLSEAIILAVMGAGVFAYRTLHMARAEIAVTTDRFVKRGGLLRPRTEEFALRDIAGVTVREGALGRLLGFGSLRVELGNGTFEIPALADPFSMCRAIETAKGTSAGSNDRS